MTYLREESINSRLLQGFDKNMYIFIGIGIFFVIFSGCMIFKLIRVQRRMLREFMENNPNASIVYMGRGGIMSINPNGRVCPSVEQNQNLNIPLTNPNQQVQNESVVVPLPNNVQPYSQQFDNQGNKVLLPNSNQQNQNPKEIQPIYEVEPTYLKTNNPNTTDNNYATIKYVDI